jgi:hypothetical protein
MMTGPTRGFKMPMQPVVMNHIVVDERGVARLAATPRYKLRFIVVEATALGMTPEEIVAAHPDVLNLAQVHAALSYYYDNKEAMDVEIAEGEAEADRLYEEIKDTAWENDLRERIGRLKRERAGS